MLVLVEGNFGDIADLPAVSMCKPYMIDYYSGNPFKWKGACGDKYQVILMTKDNKIKYQGDLKNIDINLALKNVYAGKDVVISNKDEQKKIMEAVKAWLAEYNEKYQTEGWNYQPDIALKFCKNFHFNGKSKYDVFYNRYLLTIQAKEGNDPTSLPAFEKVKAFKQITVVVEPPLKTLKIKLQTDCGICKAKKLAPPFYFDVTANMLVCPKCEKDINGERNYSEEKNKSLLYLKYDPKVDKKFANELIDYVNSGVSMTNFTDYYVPCVGCKQACGGKGFAYVDMLKQGTARYIQYCIECFNKYYAVWGRLPNELARDWMVTMDTNCFAFNKIPV